MPVLEMGQGTLTDDIQSEHVHASCPHRPIHDAIEIGALEVVKLLVEYGADPTAELGDKSPLDLAKTLKTPEMLNYLQRKPFSTPTLYAIMHAVPNHECAFMQRL